MFPFGIKEFVFAWDVEYAHSEELRLVCIVVKDMKINNI